MAPPTPAAPGGLTMARMLYLALSLIGGWIGWAVGDRFGIMSAMFLGLVGTAIGVYLARRVNSYFS
jgi:uncharacterized membrane protein YeaQ/YmgE (transglycosylase-associated protein family)